MKSQTRIMLYGYIKLTVISFGTQFCKLSF